MLYCNYNKRQEREKFIAAINQEMIINIQTLAFENSNVALIQIDS